MIDFFISYAREDGDFARALVERLDQHEWAVWIDEEDIPPSVPWMTEIQHAINESMMVIAIASSDWHASEACLIELGLAEQGRVPIVRVTPDPFRVDAVVAQVITALRALPAWRPVALQANSAAAIWDSADRPRTLLLRGQPLRIARNTLAARPADFSATARTFVTNSRQAAVRRWVLGIALGFIAPVLGLGISVSLLVAGTVNERVAQNVADYTAYAERSTYADWNVYSGLERAPSDIADSYTRYYELFSFLAERTPSAWDPAPVAEVGAQAALSPDGFQSAKIDGAKIEVTTAAGTIKRLVASAPVSAVAWSPDSRWIAVSTDTGADVISVDNAQVIPLRGGSGRTTSVRWDGPADVIVGGSAGSGTWHVFDGSPIAEIDGVRFGTSVDGALYTVSAVGTVSKTELASGQTTVLPTDGAGTPAAMDSSGSTVVVAFDGSEPYLRVIDAASDSSKNVAMPGCSPVALSVSPDASAAYLACSGVTTNQARVDLATGEMTSQPMQQQIAFGVRALDDRVLWGGYFGLIMQSGLDLTPGGIVTSNAGCVAPIRKFVGASDGTALFQIGDATGSFSCASRIELSADDDSSVGVHRLIFPVTDGHAVPDASTSPDGSLVAYGLSDGRVRVFTTSGFYPVYFGQVLPCQVRSISFTPDGANLVVAGSNGEVIVLPLPSTPAAERADELTADALARLENAVDWGIYSSTMTDEE